MNKIEAAIRTISGRRGTARLGGITHKLTVVDNCVILEPCQLHGHWGTKITLRKNRPYELIYLSEPDCWRTDIASCHLQAAIEVASEIIGPDHFASLEAMHRCESRLAFRSFFKRAPLGVIGLRWRAWIFWRGIYHWWMSRYRKPTRRIEWD